MAAGDTKRMYSAERKMKERLAANVSTSSGGGVDTSGISNEDLMTAINALKSELLMKKAHDNSSDSHEDRVNARQSELQEAENELDTKLDEVNLLRTEVRALSRSIHDTKREIKALGMNEEDKFSVVTNELDEIVGATERATETILGSAEKVDDLAQQLRQHSPDQFVTQLTDEILENTISMFEACNFQDLCGQRTTKVVNTLKFIEERVEKMMEIWGEDTFDTVDHPDEVKAAELNKAPEGEELHGPAEHGGGISQADIDALFD
jgi:chemotaxis protein CheZ